VQLDAVIGLCYTDIKKLLERIQEQGALGSKAEGAVPVKLLPNMNHFHPISIVRHRKRKRFNGARRKKSRKRRLVIKKQRQRLHMRNKMAMHKATGKNNTFCFHVDWSKLTTATALDPRTEYLAELPISANQDSVHNLSKSSNDIVFYKYADLKVTTDNFDNQSVKDGGRFVGSGSYGDVFLAQVEHCGSKKDAAVKKLKQPRNERSSVMHRWRKQLQTEVSVLVRSRAENLLQLFGISTDGPELCIVFEYMPDGTLAQHLSKDCPSPLHWKTRMETIVGTCQGIKYLHTVMEPPIIHRDIKRLEYVLYTHGLSNN
jgi:hypothetical protein